MRRGPVKRGAVFWTFDMDVWSERPGLTLGAQGCDAVQATSLGTTRRPPGCKGEVRKKI
jgi:hypothetical protein